VSASLSPVLCLVVYPVCLSFPTVCKSALHFLLQRKEGAKYDRVFLGRGDGVIVESSVSVLRAGLRFHGKEKGIKEGHGS